MGKAGTGSSDMMAGRTAVAAMLGGLAAEASGGSFRDGAMTAAMVHLFNELSKRMAAKDSPLGTSTLGAKTEEEANKQIRIKVKYGKQVGYGIKSTGKTHKFKLGGYVGAYGAVSDAPDASGGVVGFLGAEAKIQGGLEIGAVAEVQGEISHIDGTNYKVNNVPYVADRSTYNQSPNHITDFDLFMGPITVETTYEWK